MLFSVDNLDALPNSLNAPANQATHLMIWTTTPWTLPANLAVAVAPHETYGLYQWQRNNKTERAIIGKQLSDKVLTNGGISNFEELGTCTGEELIASKPYYTHPFIEKNGPVLLADYVTMEDGTGLVHTAPGHGEDDNTT